MDKQNRLDRLNARYIALRYAYSWISEPAEQHYNSDFYSEIEANYMLDESKLNDEIGYGAQRRKCFCPSDKDIEIIKKEFVRLTKQIANQLIKTRAEYEELLKAK